MVFIEICRRPQSDVINFARLKSGKMNRRFAVQSNNRATIILKSFKSTIKFYFENLIFRTFTVVEELLFYIKTK